MTVSVVGGDLRSVYLVKRMLRDGHQVRCFGLDAADIPLQHHCNTLADTVEETECVVLPTPAMDGSVLRMPLSDRTVTAAEIAAVLPSEVPVFAGAPGPTLTALCQDNRVRLIDLLAVPSLTMKNAALTAECAVGLILQEVPYALMGEPVLILGAGRIGKQLAIKLHGLGAQVTVAARKPEDRAWCVSHDMGAADVYELMPTLSGFRLAVNTIPVQILSAELLGRLPSGARLVELASKPGGFDPTVAKHLGVQVIPAGGLPGKFAPESAADAIAETIYSMIER